MAPSTKNRAHDKSAMGTERREKQTQDWIRGHPATKMQGGGKKKDKPRETKRPRGNARKGLGDGSIRPYDQASGRFAFNHRDKLPLDEEAQRPSCDFGWEEYEARMPYTSDSPMWGAEALRAYTETQRDGYFAHWTLGMRFSPLEMPITPLTTPIKASEGLMALCGPSEMRMTTPNTKGTEIVADDDLLVYEMDSQSWSQVTASGQASEEQLAGLQSELNRLEVQSRQGDSFAEALCRVARAFESKAAGADPWALAIQFPGRTGLNPMYLGQWLSLQQRADQTSWFSDDTLLTMIQFYTKDARPDVCFGEPCRVAPYLCVNSDLETRIQRCKSIILACKNSDFASVRLPHLSMSASCTSLVLPFNTGNHWLTVEIQPSSGSGVGSIFVYDSLPSPKNMQAVRNIIPLFAEMVSSTPLSPWAYQDKWEIEARQSSLQHNWTDCGPITAWNCAHRLNGNDVDLDEKDLRLIFLKDIFGLLVEGSFPAASDQHDVVMDEDPGQPGAVQHPPKSSCSASTSEQVDSLSHGGAGVLEASVDGLAGQGDAWNPSVDDGPEVDPGHASVAVEPPTSGAENDDRSSNAQSGPDSAPKPNSKGESESHGESEDNIPVNWSQIWPDRAAAVQKMVDAQQNKVEFAMSVARLEDEATSGNWYAPALVRIAQLFEAEDRLRPAVVANSDLSNPHGFSMEFRHAKGLHGLTFPEWCCIERRDDDSQDCWFFDNTLANMVILEVADPATLRLFGDPADLFIWLSTQYPTDERLKVIQAAIEFVVQNGQMPETDTGARLFFPGFEMPARAPFFAFPYNTGGHWVGIVLRPDFQTQQGKIEVYDSLAAQSVLNKVEKYIRPFANLVNLRPDLQWQQTSWEVVRQPCTIQNNSTDCGPIAAYNLSCALKRQQPTVHQRRADVWGFGRTLCFDYLKALFRAFTTEQMPMPSDTEEGNAAVGGPPDHVNANTLAVGNGEGEELQTIDHDQPGLEDSFVEPVNYREVLCDALEVFGEESEDMLLDYVLAHMQGQADAGGTEMSEGLDVEMLSHKLKVILNETDSMFEPVTDNRWRLVPGLGRSIGSATRLRMMTAGQAPESTASAAMKHLPVRTWRLAISIVRASGGLRRLRGTMKNQRRAQELMEAYWQKFHGDQGPLPAKADVLNNLLNNGVDAQSWFPVYMENRSSRSCALLTARTSDETQARGLLDQLNSHARRNSRRSSVLLLSNGYDGLSTDNETWSSVLSRWRWLDFTLVAALPSETIAPVLSIGSGAGAAWSFFDLNVLASLYGRTQPPPEVEDEGTGDDKGHRVLETLHHEQFIFACQSIDCLKLDASLSRLFPDAGFRQYDDNSIARCMSAVPRNRFVLERDLEEAAREAEARKEKERSRRNRFVLEHDPEEAARVAEARKEKERTRTNAYKATQKRKVEEGDEIAVERKARYAKRKKDKYDAEKEKAAEGDEAALAAIAKRRETWTKWKTNTYDANKKKAAEGDEAALAAIARRRETWTRPKTSTYDAEKKKAAEGDEAALTAIARRSQRVVEGESTAEGQAREREKNEKNKAKRREANAEQKRKAEAGDKAAIAARAHTRERKQKYYSEQKRKADAGDEAALAARVHTRERKQKNKAEQKRKADAGDEAALAARAHTREVWRKNKAEQKRKADAGDEAAIAARAQPEGLG